MATPDLSGEPGWLPLTTFAESLGTRSFVSSEDGDRIRVRYYADDEGTVWARAWFGPEAEGPPGQTHGGALAALLDEAMGMAALTTGRIVVAARIEVDFRALVPLERVVTIRATVGEAVGKKVRVHSLLRLGDSVACEASGLFVEIGREGMGRAAADRAPTG